MRITLSLLLLAIVSSIFSGHVLAGPRAHREFRLEQAQLTDAIRQDMHQNLQRIKAAADAQGPTSTASVTNLDLGLAKDPKDLRRKLES